MNIGVVSPALNSIRAASRRSSAGAAAATAPPAPFDASWIRAGTAVDVVQELLGHRHLESTRIYLHASLEEKYAAVALAIEQRMKGQA